MGNIPRPADLTSEVCAFIYSFATLPLRQACSDRAIRDWLSIVRSQQSAGTVIRPDRSYPNRLTLQIITIPQIISCYPNTWRRMCTDSCEASCSNTINTVASLCDLVISKEHCFVSGGDSRIFKSNIWKYKLIYSIAASSFQTLPLCHRFLLCFKCAVRRRKCDFFSLKEISNPDSKSFLCVPQCVQTIILNKNRPSCADSSIDRTVAPGISSFATCNSSEIWILMSYKVKATQPTSSGDVRCVAASSWHPGRG